VRIDLHHHLLHNRRNAVRSRFDDPIQRILFRAWLWAMQSPTRYAIAGKVGNLALRLGIAQPLLKPWTAQREFPTPPRQSFKDYWRQHGRRA
jgi:L-lactate dehydrogenase complex protein LldF